MKRINLESMAIEGFALDTETYLIQPGLLAPPMVCGSIGWLQPEGNVAGALLDKEETLHAFVELLESPCSIIVTANGSFDLLVLATMFARRGIDVMPKIFAALAEHRIYDIQIAEALDAVANGCLFKDPRTGGGPLLNPETGKRGRYSLAMCVDLVLGRKDAKTHDDWRLRYGELDNVPIEQWPELARVYPIDDAKNTIEVGLAQTGHVPKASPFHSWGPRGSCTQCGANKFGGTCLTKTPHQNLHDLSNQVYTAFAMHLGAAWGFHVNQDAVSIIERCARRNQERGVIPFIAAKLLRDDGTEDRSELKRRVAIAYGATEPCAVCAGTGHVPSPSAKPVRCSECRGRSAPWKWGGRMMAPTVTACAFCASTGLRPNPNAPMIVCHTVDGDTRIKTCDGTGFVLSPGVPRSDKEGIGYGRDVLHESGDEFLMQYADYLEDSKTLDVYVPYLRTARIPNEDGTYRDIPLTLRPNVVLETGRTSYDGVIQLFPRKPGHLDPETGEWVPSLRECIQARPGWVLGSVDYNFGELVTHSQSLIWITGQSKLGDALLAGVDPHSALAATVLGISYEEFIKRAKEPVCKNARQAAKPFTFGMPGGMGPVKLVLQQRKQGPDTFSPTGPNKIKDENGALVPGYKGLRFCILMDGAEACGVRKVTEWRDRKIPPTCAQCIECAIRLKSTWQRQWPEHTKYFQFISSCIDHGMVITWEALQRWPHLQDFFYTDQQLAPGEIMQHVSGRVRGGTDYCSAANGFFQALLGDAAKSAVRRISRECYDHTLRVPAMAHKNSKRSAYANAPSPLLGSRLVVFQHDEIIPEMPVDNAHDAITRVSEIAVEELSVYCPDLAPTVKAEPTLMTRWLKSASKVVRDGKVVPWEPAMA